jgi:hypothetical protein
MNEDVIFVTDNIAIVQTQGNVCLLPPIISADELSTYYGTVSLPIAESKPLIENENTNIKLLFGSWVESGTEDELLDELYSSRLIPSKYEG